MPLSKVCFVVMRYTQCSSNFNRVIFVLTVQARNRGGLTQAGCFWYARCHGGAKPKVSLLVSVFSVWGRVIIVLVNERVSINTPKASFSVSTSNQPSAEQLRERERERESNKPESRLMGDRVGEGQEAGEALWREGRRRNIVTATHKPVAISDERSERCDSVEQTGRLKSTSCVWPLCR